jgi:hypothetical protein
MSVDDYRQQELSHIERMVVELERLVQDGRIIAERNAVVRPEYWRKRIDALVSSSAASGSTTERAAVLLERLSTLSEVLVRNQGLDQIKQDQS